MHPALPVSISQDTSEAKATHLKDCMTTRYVNLTTPELTVVISCIQLLHPLSCQVTPWSRLLPGLFLSTWLSNSTFLVLSWVPVAIISPVCVP